MNENSTNEIKQEGVEINTQNAKKTKKIPIIICTVLLVLVIVVLFAVTLYIKNPKVILSQNITKLYNNLIDSKESNNILKNILNSNTVMADSNIEITLEDDANTFKDFNNIKFNTKYIEDKKAKEGYLTLDSSIANNDFISLDALLSDNKIYIKLKDVMDNYYYSDYKFTSLLSNSDNDDMKYILDIFKNNIIKNIENSNLTTKKDTIKINDKDTKVKKISLKINDKLINSIIKDSLNEFKNNSKAKKIIIENLDISESDLNEFIDQSLKEINTTSGNQLNIYYNMYVKGLNKVVKQEISMDSYSLGYLEYNDTKEVYMSVYNQKMLEIKISGDDSKGKITGSLSILKINGSYDKDKVNLTIEPQGFVSGENKITVELKNKNASNNKEYKNECNMLIEVMEEGKKLFKVTAKITSNIKPDEKIPNIDINNSKDMNEITIEEQNEITEKILEIPGIKMLVEMMEVDNSTVDDYSF